jgi:transcriptional regulator with XRE-family HTH domain
MPPRTRKLLKELKAWCDQEHGRQAEVARYLKLPRQAISNWFGERSWPTGEQVLAIQEFLGKQKHSK